MRRDKIIHDWRYLKVVLQSKELVQLFQVIALLQIMIVRTVHSLILTLSDLRLLLCSLKHGHNEISLTRDQGFIYELFVIELQ